jgi:hypothetical protein
VAKKAKTDDAQAADGTATLAGPTDETASGYFRQYFKQHPRQLWKRSNEKALKQWVSDHPGHSEPPPTVKNTLANIKSQLRKVHPRKSARTAGEGEPAAAPPAPTRARPKDLQQLEERIDGCMMLVREIDAEGLDDVFQLLRQARNHVVWKAGGLA